jgi:hypothetical protein
MMIFIWLFLSASADANMNPEWKGTYVLRQFERLKLYRSGIEAQPPTFNYTKVFDRSSYPLKKINTKQKFTAYAKSLYLKNKSQFALKSLPQELSEASFYMNFVSSLFHYGNIKNTHRQNDGCVLRNERTGFKQVPDEKGTISFYLNSVIGCCTDYTKLLNLLLDSAKIENRIVEVHAWHVFNEVKVEGKRYTLDANTNLLFLAGWKNLMKRKKRSPYRYIKFPHMNVVPNKNYPFNRVLAYFIDQFINLADYAHIQKFTYKPKDGYKIYE